MPSRAPAGEKPRAHDDEARRRWWRAVVEILRSPVAVFTALRDDADDAASAARQEPALLLVILSGIAAVLSFSDATATLLDDPVADGAVVAVVVFLGGSLYGIAGYWLGALALHMGIHGAKGESTFRLDRHLLAYALTPLALSLFVVWPIRLIAFQGDNFTRGGSDEGVAGWVFTGISLGFLVWALGLLFLGVRVVHGFTVIRSLGALLLASMALGALGLVAVLLGAGL